MELFDYDPATGIVRRKIGVASNARAGDIVGSIKPGGKAKYYFVTVDGTQFYLHRIIYLYMTGDWPDCVDHKNLDKIDNRWSNLRAATYSQNNANQAARKLGQPKGVSWARRERKWRSSLQYEGQDYWLGYFDTADAAQAAYEAKAVEICGEFARAR